MAEPDPTEREALLAQLRGLSGFQPMPPAPQGLTVSQPVVRRLSALEERRLRSHLERLVLYRAEQGRLPSAGPAAAPGGRLGGMAVARTPIPGGRRLDPHTAELLEKALAPYWHLPP